MRLNFVEHYNLFLDNQQIKYKSAKADYLMNIMTISVRV